MPRSVPTAATSSVPQGASADPGGGAWVPPPVAPVDPYPLQFQVDYPDRPLSRVSTFFRIFAAIPILIVAALMQPDVFNNSRGGGGYAAVATGILFLPVLVMLVFRRKYPGWWFDWNLELTRFTTRISAYLLLLDDRYPSTDDHQSVHLDLERPDGAALSRWLPLVKWLLAIPALHRPVRAVDRRVRRRRVCVVRHPLHRPLSALGV